MSRDYPGRVQRRTIALGIVMSVVAVAVLIGLTTWLRVEGTGEALPAPAEPSATTPGALVCSEPSIVSGGQPAEVAAGEMIDCPDVYDGRSVTFTGEVIEAVFTRAGRPVVVLNDDDYALGPGPVPQTRTALGGNSGLTVLLPAGFADQIRHAGSYDARGDLVRVTGTFNAANRQLQGEPAIDALTAEITQRGRSIEHEVSKRTVIAALLAAAVAAAAAWLARHDPDLPRRRRPPA